MDGGYHEHDLSALILHLYLYSWWTGGGVTIITRARALKKMSVSFFTGLVPSYVYYKLQPSTTVCVLSHRPLAQLRRALGRAQSSELDLRRENEAVCPGAARNLVDCATVGGGGSACDQPHFPKIWSNSHIFCESATWLVPAYLHVQSYFAGFLKDRLLSVQLSMAKILRDETLPHSEHTQIHIICTLTGRHARTHTKFCQE